MRITSLQKFDLIYVASPYSRYPTGIEEAFRDVCRLTARLLTAGLKVYSPIAHTHCIATHGDLDPLDHDLWLPFDASIMAKSNALLVATMAGWDTSYGVAHEIAAFKAACKPMFTVCPETLAIGGAP